MSRHWARKPSPRDPPDWLYWSMVVTERLGVPVVMVGLMVWLYVKGLDKVTEAVDRNTAVLNRAVIEIRDWRREDQKQ